MSTTEERKAEGYRRRGRPKGQSAERDERLLRALSEGATRRAAAELVGIKKASLEARMSRNEAFARRVKDAEAVGRTAVPVQTGIEHLPFNVWRERFMWYRDHRTGQTKRATTNFYQRDSYQRLQDHNRLIIILPPGHLKTTTFSTEYTTWRIMRDRNSRALVVQKAHPEAKKVIGAVKERLEHDYYHLGIEQLKAQGDEPNECPICVYFPDAPFKPEGRYSGDKWGAEGFRVLGITSGEKDDTFQAKGYGSQIQGIRADLIVIDDLQDPSMARRSVMDSEEKLRWFNEVILGRVTEAQQVVVLGNYFSPNDFAHKVIADHPDYPVYSYPAVLTEHPLTKQPYTKPRALCPEYWTIEALDKKRKEVGENVWWYTWQQETGTFEDQTFKREALEAARDDRLSLGDVPLGASDFAMGVDPAVATSGYCSIVVWALNRKTKQRYLIDVFNKAGMRNWDNVIAQIVKFCKQYPPGKVIIEKNNVQGSLIDNPTYARAITSTGWRYDTYQTTTGTGASSTVTNYDITVIGGLFDAGLITIPYGGDSEQRDRVDHYINQLVAWHTDEEGRSIKHLPRDMVMGTLFAESVTFKIANKPSETPTQDTRRLPRWASQSFRRFHRED